MRVLFVSHSSVTAYHQQKLEELVKNHGIDIHLAIPPSWPEGGAAVRASTQSSLIKYHVGSTVNVRGMQHFYADAGAIITGSKPDIIHIEEEPFTLACAQFTSHAKKRGIPSVFFTWENIERRYNPVYSFLNRYSTGNCAAAV